MARILVCPYAPIDDAAPWVPPRLLGGLGVADINSDVGATRGRLPNTRRFELKQSGAVEGLHPLEPSLGGLAREFNRATAGVILRSCTGLAVGSSR